MSILASLAFGSELDFDGVATTGIRHLIAADIAEAQALGFRVRLVGLAEADGDGLFQRVHPCLVPMAHPLAHVAGSLNAVVAEGNFVGRLFFQGAGAVDGPTASAVVADLIDVARNEYGPAFAMPVGSLARPPRADSGDRTGRTFLRLTVQDRTGVLAEIAAAMRDAMAHLKLVVEPGGAAALAALSSGEIGIEGRTVAVVLSGGNVDFATYARLIAQAA